MSGVITFAVHRSIEQREAFSRRIAPESLRRELPFQHRRAQGRPGPAGPMVRVQQKSTRQNHRFSQEHPAFPARRF